MADPEPVMWVDDNRVNPEWYQWVERNRSLYLGPEFLDGRTCHGCGKQAQNWDKTRHRKACPKSCTWKICAYHGRSVI